MGELVIDEDFEKKLMEQYRAAMREYGRAEGMYSDGPTSEKARRMHILWGECKSFKAALELVKEFKDRKKRS